MRPTTLLLAGLAAMTAAGGGLLFNPAAATTVDGDHLVEVLKASPDADRMLAGLTSAERTAVAARILPASVVSTVVDGDGTTSTKVNPYNIDLGCVINLAACVAFVAHPTFDAGSGGFPDVRSCGFVRGRLLYKNSLGQDLFAWNSEDVVCWDGVNVSRQNHSHYPDVYRFWSFVSANGTASGATAPAPVSQSVGAGVFNFCVGPTSGFGSCLVESPNLKISVTGTSRWVVEGEG